MRTDEIILFVRRLALFLRAGIPINTALEMLRQDTQRKKSLRIVTMLAEDVLQGKRLSDALARFPRIFDSLHISLIEVGEASGALAGHLEQVAVLCARRRDDRQRIISTLTYPLIIVFATIALTAFLTLYAFPKILPLLRGFHQALPLSTRMLIGLTEFVQFHGWILVVAGIGLSAGIPYALRYSFIRRGTDRLSLHLPFFGQMLQHYYAASITRTLSTLLESGIGILPALALLARGIRHSAYADALVRMRERISEGRPIAQGFSEESHLFPVVIAQLVKAGELSGTLPESLRNAAQIYEQYLEEQSRLLQALIEPALMLIMGCIVGFVALAIISPIYGITQGISAT
ncbi:MAG: type secretion system protein [Parcubacteria group bacterium]|nr:type secretion system protein [Parcubacteria group bacterium]